MMDRSTSLAWLPALLVLVAALAGAAEPSKPPVDAPRPAIRDLGPPLVDEPSELKKLHPVQPVWLDRKHHQVVLLGEVCKADYPLEFFATYRARGYESVVVIDAKPSIVHAALLALGALPGHPATVQPRFEPASGSEIVVLVRWKDKDGHRQQTNAREWIRDRKTKKPLDLDWVFAGSRIWKEEDTGKTVYQADTAGDLIAVLNVPAATLDLPIQSASAIESRLFEAFAERMPPSGTPVTILFGPKETK